jgi:hypothetical protein
VTQEDMDEIIRCIAAATLHDLEVVEAGLEFSARKARRAHPPGSWDHGGRFHARERTDAVLRVRAPSRAFPFSELHAARSAAHLAELHGCIDRTAEVKRLGKARDRISEGVPLDEIEAFLRRGETARAACAAMSRTSAPSRRPAKLRAMGDQASAL